MSLEKAQTKYMEAKTAMLLYCPFFAALLLDMMTVKVGKFPELGDNPTAGTDGKTIFMDEDFIAKMPLPQVVFLICHEIGHAMWQHMARAKRYKDTGLFGYKFMPVLYNVAADYVINDLLVKAKIGTFITGGLLHEKYTSDAYTVEEVYKELLKDCPEGGDGDGDGKGSGMGGVGPNGASGKCIDTHIPAEAKADDMDWKRAVQSAADNAKAQGKLPANLARFVEELVNPQVPWQEILRTVITKIACRDITTWSKPNRRRLITQGVVMPGYTGFGSGTIVVGVDTSGSIGQKTLKVFLSELQGILDIARPERVIVVPCDAKVHVVTELQQGDSLLSAKVPFGGGGGTDFRPVFDWVQENGIEADALVYLTDMYGTFPDRAPGYQTVWCSISKSMAAPFGTVIEIDEASYVD